MLDLHETGRNIAKIRLAQGLTQEEAAFRAGLSVTRWQSIERGCENITIDTLARVAKALGVDPVVLGLLTKSDREIGSIWSTVQDATAIQGVRDLGKVITELRKSKNITQRALSKKSNVSVARLRDIEHGCANATTKVLERIAQALGLSLLGLGMLTVVHTEMMEMIRHARSMGNISVA